MKKTILFGNLLTIYFAFFTSAAFSQFKVVGYIPTWSAMYPANINTISLSKLTHLNIAFANPNATGTLIPSNGTNANVATAVSIAHAHNLKVLMSIGGGGAAGTNYHNLITNNQTSFVNSIVNYAISNNLDGIDVDIEGNILDGTTLTAAQYQGFVTELGTSLHAQGKIMTCALATWFGNYVTTKAANQFDFINIMSYDATGPWAPQNPRQHSPYSMAVSDFQYWNGTIGVPSTKLTIGVPFYGYGFGTYANQGISYCDIANTYPGSKNNDQVGTGGNTIYYNGIPTIAQKTTYALQNAGGIMIWELSQDCFNNNSLLSVIDSVIASQHTDVKNEISSPLVDIWPNPTQGILSVSSTNGFGKAAISVYNLIREKPIQQFTIKNMNDGFSTNISNLPNGIYFIEVKTDEYKIVKLIVLNK